MTIINPNSISGISSITALNSTAAINLFKADGTSANIIAGVTTGANFITGTSNVHSTGYECTNINATGVVTAAQFKGDGSNLSGLASREFYGFVGVGSHLQLVYTNNGADNISSTSYASLEENFFGPSGITFEINTDGRLIATV